MENKASDTLTGKIKDNVSVEKLAGFSRDRCAIRFVFSFFTLSVLFMASCSALEDHQETLQLKALVDSTRSALEIKCIQHTNTSIKNSPCDHLRSTNQ